MIDRAAVYDILSYIRLVRAVSGQHYAPLLGDRDVFPRKRVRGMGLGIPKQPLHALHSSPCVWQKRAMQSGMFYCCLPRQIHFHVLYYEQLALHVEEKLNKLLMES